MFSFKIGKIALSLSFEPLSSSVCTGCFYYAYRPLPVFATAVAAVKVVCTTPGGNDDMALLDEAYEKYDWWMRRWISSMPS